MGVEWRAGMDRPFQVECAAWDRAKATPGWTLTKKDGRRCVVCDVDTLWRDSTDTPIHPHCSQAILDKLEYPLSGRRASGVPEQSVVTRSVATPDARRSMERECPF